MKRLSHVRGACGFHCCARAVGRALVLSCASRQIAVDAPCEHGTPSTFFCLSALDPTSQLFAEHGEVEEVFVMRGGSRSGQCAVMYSED